MPTAPSRLEDTALAAPGGGTVLNVQTDAARPAPPQAVVLKDGLLLHVTLDGLLKTAVVATQAPTAPPSRRSALALR